MFSKKAEKILKDTNALDLIPVTKHGYKINEDGKVVLLIPKFKNQKFARWFIPARKSIHFSIRLDNIGSMVYLLIDGKRTIKQICDTIQDKHEEKIEQLENRAVAFITQMYKYRFITFEQLIASGMS